MKRCLLLFAGLCFLSIEINATHIKAAELTFKPITSGTLTYEFILTGFLDSGSPVGFGHGTIDFGDGKEFQLDLVAKSFVRGIFLGASDQVEQYIITMEHTFNSPGRYSISYKEPNRNASIVNRDSSIQSSLYIEASLFVDPVIGSNGSPIFQTYPIDNAFPGVTFTHNLWAYDLEGDSLAYRMVVPEKDRDMQLDNYRQPNDPKFYLSASPGYNLSNEDQTGPPTFSIDPVKGDLIWDAPGEVIGSYNVAILVEEWRKVNDNWVRIGTVMRDMLIEVQDQTNHRAKFNFPSDTVVNLDTSLEVLIDAIESEGENLMVATFSETYSLPQNPAISSLVTTFQPSPVSVSFNWDLIAAHFRYRPYLIHFKVIDQPSDPDVPAAVTYQTWRINFTDQPDVVLALNGEELAYGFYMFPNPVDRVLQFRFVHPQKDQFLAFNIYDPLGKSIKTAAVTQDQEGFQVDVGALNPGAYLFRLKSKLGIWTKKFIKL